MNGVIALRLCTPAPDLANQNPVGPMTEGSFEQVANRDCPFSCAGIWFPHSAQGNQRTALTGERKLPDQKAGAEGNGRDMSPRVARQCASGGGIIDEGDRAGTSGAAEAFLVRKTEEILGGFHCGA